MEASLLIQSNCELGEGPLWHSERKSLWWVDILTGNFFEYSPLNKNVITHHLPFQVSLIVETSYENILVLAVNDGLLKYNIESREYQRLLFLEKDILGNRTNDGACDSQGRLWLGTMDSACKINSGKLYCINDQLNIEEKIIDTFISNGICWSLPNDVMYFIDSATYKVESYHFNNSSSQINFKKTVVHISENEGMPDGMTIDEEGMLWVALWGSFGVCRYDPLTGKLLDKIDLPVPNVTSCVFGGKNLDILFITSAKTGLSQIESEKYPLSGSVFSIAPGIRGMHSNKFKF